MGTWTLNISKSTYDPGPAPKAGTRTIVARGDGVMLSTTALTGPQGNELTSQSAVKDDGQDYPLTIKGLPDIATVAIRRPDRHTVEYTVKVNGTVTTTMTATVSEDGQTITERSGGTNPLGQSENNVLVWERQ